MGSLTVIPEPLELAPGEQWFTRIYSPDVLKALGSKPLWKVDEQTHTVYGLSTAQVPDADKEIADYDGSKQSYQEWSDATEVVTSAAGQRISKGNIRLQHTTQIAGKATRFDYLDDKKQIFALTEPIKDDKIWDLLAGGFVTGFSHAGRYLWRRCNDCGYDLPSGNYCPQCHKEVCALYRPSLSEISYVDRPCLGIAVFQFVKTSGQVELRKFVAPAAKKVLVDLGELAELARASFAQAMADLEKRARSPIGQFANNAPGPEHDAAVAAGYEHQRTGTQTDGAAEPVTTRSYAHPSGASLTLCEDGRWTHADGKGRTTTGTGAEAFSSHLAACHAKKSADGAGKDVTEMSEEEVQKLVSDQVAMALKARAKKDDDGDDDDDDGGEQIECPVCGAEIDVSADDDDDEIECPECGAEVALKAHKARKAARARLADLRKQIADAIDRRTVALRKDMTQVGRLADILQGIRWLQQSSFWEGQMEQDDRDFAIADRLGDWLQEGVNILNAIVADETSELTTDLVPPALKAATNNEGDDAMNREAIELLNKAAKGLKGHFGKAAGFHEQVAAAHKAAGESDKEMADAHKSFGKVPEKAEDEQGKAHKAFHKVGFDHHTAKAAHHEKMHKLHSAMCDACKAAAADLGGAEAKADNGGDLNKALGDTQAAILEPITKALAALEKLDAMGKAIETLQADVTKMGNETLPTLVKGAGAPGLVERPISTPTPEPAAAPNSSNLFA
jgi:DNA-directed RNA polymerase subunit RPC12/RpoP